MKGWLSTLIVASMILFTYTGSAAEMEVEQLGVYEEDLSGDGNLEIIELYGVRLDASSSYYKDVYAIIKSTNKQWEIHYPGGYDPELQFVDLNQDGIADLFYKSRDVQSEARFTQNLYTLASGKLTEVLLPEQKYIHGEFENDFQAVLRIAPHTNSEILKLEDKRNEYINHGLYDETGQLLRKTALQISPVIYYELFKMSNRQGYGLKSTKQISGINPGDQLGNFVSYWYYENGRWVSVGSEVQTLLQ